MGTKLEIIAFEPKHFDDVIKLGNAVHGDNYLSHESLQVMLVRGLKDGINASLVAYNDDTLVGFRLTWAPGNWPIDHWCNPELWGYEPSEVCYFKCNTVDERFRGAGIGGKLLRQSIALTKQQGAKAGLSHIWLQSPGNSAYKYMSKAGGKIIKEHPDRWYDSSINDGYYCVICKGDCHCSAAEMLLEFD